MMMPIDLTPLDLWLPPRAAIIRPADQRLIKASFLPGMFPAGAAAAAAAAAASPLTSISLFDSATQGNSSSSAAITVPSGVQAGDLLVLQDFALHSGGVPTAVTPTGWTNIVDTSGTPARLMISYKLADGSEGGTSVTGMGDASNMKCLYIFRGDAPATLLTASTPNQQNTGSNPSSQTVSASGQTTPLVIIGGYAAVAGTVSPRTFSPAKDGEIEQTSVALLSADTWLAYKIYNSSPANVSVDMDDESNNYLASFYVQMSN